MLLWCAYLLINAITFCLYGMDKRRARKGLRRISERTLLACTWLMGGVGALCGMRVFRHKTKHLRFRFSVPVAATLSVAMMCVLSVRG